MDNTVLKKILSENKKLQKDLFVRGFLITDKEIENIEEFPFYGNWKVQTYGGYQFLAHELTGMHIYEDEQSRVFFLMGHAYDPFLMEWREQEILKALSKAYDSENYIEKINELTGVFVYGTIVNGKIDFIVDPSGMQSACYGKVGETFYLSSHAQLIGDLCGLEMDDFVKELIQYKWYGRVMGPYLPADLTPFSNVKRIVPSIWYSYQNEVKHYRFWPLKEAVMAENAENYQTVIREAADILKKNMQLVAESGNIHGFP